LSLGSNIKIARIERNLTGKTLAERVGVSPSLISKIENDITTPSFEVLRRISVELQMPMGDLVDNDPITISSSTTPALAGNVFVVRENQRRLLYIPDSDFTYQLLTPTLQGLAEFVWVELKPGGDLGQLHCEEGEEYTLVLQGTLNVYIEDKVYVLHQGDTIIFDNRLAHGYKNEGTEKVIFVYVGIPPSL
jgi:transcriptional regulator with XRE-family HTH domain